MPRKPDSGEFASHNYSDYKAAADGKVIEIQQLVSDEVPIEVNVL